MPEHHSSIVGGSTVTRRLQCPGSMALEAKVPDPGSSVYAQEGIDLHTAMEGLFDYEATHLPMSLLGEMVGDIPALSHEQVAALQWCYEIVDAAIQEHEYQLETWGEFPGIKDAGGTCDVTIFNTDGSYTLMDYKFGRGVPVSAVENKQLMFYAACMRNTFGPAHTYHVHILQPRLDSHTQWSFSDRELDTFIDHVQTAIASAREKYNVGPACRWCRGESICPAKMQTAQDVYQWRDIAHNDLAKALSMVDEVEEWAAAVRTMAHSALEHGAAIQGWKLVDKRAARVWDLPDDVLRRRLQRAGLKIDAYAPRKTISPAQAEKLGVQLKTDMVTVKSSGTTLVRESDKREAVHKGPRDLQALANAMSSKQKEDM